ncbi:alpha/beta fold hydrolase [Ramlibacter solisilvae]|uniref:Permease n=1 Tax=Ramlibacter tataouinensis TaxID=94132 RepID=A0A127JRP9_9BURK|nr:alpha/beta fold hydrolase [Ramlibacter tataouinensis]AMO22668.1 permease [Ramlibacter tataouinensis]
MTTRADLVAIPVDGKHLAGTLVQPDAMVPGVVLVHGWDGSQEEYVERAHGIASMGCICLTFDLRGHAAHRADRDKVSREENLRDLLAAYDLLATQPGVDPNAIAVVGSSYGGYLAALLTSMRDIRWLALRVPALYEDADWQVPKSQLERDRLNALRRTRLHPTENRALAACSEFQGDVLIVESEDDWVVPHQTIQNYVEAFSMAQSVTYRVIATADHGLSEKDWQLTYTSLLTNWMKEMLMLNASAGRAGPEASSPSATESAVPED